jgi:hypothetical protein
MKSKFARIPTLAASLITFIWFSGGANAVIIMTITDDGTDLTMTATGNYDFSLVAQDPDDGALGTNAAVAPGFFSGIYGWETGTPQNTFTVAYSGTLTGTSNAFPADSISISNPFFFDLGDSNISFNDSAPIVGTVNNTAIFFNKTLASLGMVAGESVTVTWAGGSAIIQTSVIPEPSSTLLLGLSALGLAARRKRS